MVKNCDLGLKNTALGLRLTVRWALGPSKEQQKHQAEGPLFSVVQPC